MLKKSTLSVAAMAAALLLSAGTAGAIEIQGSVTAGTIDSTHNVFGVFDLTGVYNSASDTINSAYVLFTFQDFNQLTAVNISLDSTVITTGQIGAPINFGTFFAGWLSWNVSQVALADSLLSYDIIWNSGDGVNLVGAKLTVDITKNAANSVPDGGMTLSLLGLALAGLGMARRQFLA